MLICEMVLRVKYLVYISDAEIAAEAKDISASSSGQNSGKYFLRRRHANNQGHGSGERADQSHLAPVPVKRRRKSSSNPALTPTGL